MASVTITSFDPALKQLYRDSNVKKLTYNRRPMFAMLPKQEGFGGRNMPIVLQYGNAMGRSADFSTAQTNATSVKLEDFLLTRVNDYSVATITGEAAEASRGDKVAFLSAMKTQIDSAMAALSDALESFIPRSGTGSLAAAGTVSTTSCILADINDVTNFEVGMEVVASAADGGSLRTGSATVTAVNRVTGDLTTDSNWTSQITSFAAADYMYVEGDAANGSTNVKLSGFDAWCPSGTPGTLHGVTRTTDTRLSGLTHDASSQTIEEGLVDAQSKIAREGGSPDHCFVNHVQMRRLIKELGAKKEYCHVAPGKSGMDASVGFRGVVLQGDKCEVKVVAANKCQSTVGWMLELSSWKLHTLGAPVKFLMEDGQKILRQASADGYEVRVGFRGNIGCTAPVFNCRVTLPS